MAANLDIIVSVKGDGTAEIKKITSAAKEAEQSASGLKNKTDALSSSFMSLKGVLGGLALGSIVKETIQLADTFNNMEGRLKLVTSSTQNLISVQNELFTISQRARVSFESTSDLYFRLAKSTESLGISQTRLLGVTETISKTLAISGSSAESANAALIQLGQGFASGTLRGEELNSVLEQTPALAEAIAKGMGKTVGELRALGAEGKLSAEQVFKALENQRKAVEEQFGKMPQTVGQSMTMIGNSILKMVGEMDNATGASSSLAKGMGSLSSVIDSATVAIHNFNIEIVRLQDVRKIKTFDDANTALKQIDEEIKALTVSNTLWDRTKRTLEGEGQIRYKLNQLYAARNALNSKVVTMAEQESTTQEKLSKNIHKVSDATDRKIKSYKTAKTEAEKLNAIEQSMFEDRISNGMKRFEKEIEDDAKFYQSMLDARSEADQVYINQHEKDVEKSADKMYDLMTSPKNMKVFEGFFDDFQKAMDNQLFDAMTGKWKSWGDWFKDFWSSITTSIMRSVSSMLSTSIIDEIKGAMGMTTSGSGGIQNIFSQFGLFGGSSQGSNAVQVGVGTTLTASQLNAIGGTSGQEFKTNSGTVINSSGQIVQAGTDITDIAKSIPTSTYASYVKDAYGTVSGWFGAGSGLSSAELASGEMANASTSATASSSSSLLGTAGTWLGWAAFFKTLSGFLWSDNGLNKLFGTQYGTIAHDTMKYGAGSYNWSTGQLNSGYGHLTDVGQWRDNLSYMNPYNPTQWGQYNSRDWANMSYLSLNPASAISGHMDPIFAGIMGGLFGSGETTTTPLAAWANYTLGNASANYASGYHTMPMMSSTDGGLLGGDETMYWFQKTGLTSEAISGIKKYIGALDNVLSDLGETVKLTVSGGTFKTLQDFLDTNVLYSFFDVLTTSNKVTVTNTWKKYAKSLNTTVMEAFGQVIGAKQTFERSFTEWRLGSGSTEQLKFTADYLQSDLDKYAKSIGAVGVTADNFLSKYDQAMEALYTPETSEAWQKLGQALMTATEANKAYQDSLANTTSLIMPRDMILSKSTDATNIYQVIATQTDNLKYSFAEMIQIMRKILLNQQFGAQPV